MPDTPPTGTSPASGEAPQSEVAPPPAATQPPAGPPAEPSPGPRPPAKPDALPPPRATGEFHVLCYTLLSLFLVSFGVWAVFAWMDYGKRYAPVGEGWYAGGTRTIEITLVREDQGNLDCASDVVLDGLHCAYRADQQPFDAGGTADPVRLRPYNTAENVPFLGAGLWSSLGPSASLPSERFTVTCNYHMVSTLKSVSTRWAAGGAFAPSKNALPVGRLSACVIPR